MPYFYKVITYLLLSFLFINNVFANVASKKNTLPVTKGNLVEINNIFIEDVLKKISKDSNIRIFLSGNIKEIISKEKFLHAIHNLPLDKMLKRVIGNRDHVFIYSSNRLKSAYIYANEKDLKNMQQSNNLTIEKDSGLLNSNNPQERENMLGRLAYPKFKPDNFSDYLIEGLNDEEKEVRLTAIRASVTSNSIDVLPYIRTLMYDDDNVVKRGAMSAIVELNDKSQESKKLLIEALDDKDYEVRYEAKNILEILHPQN